MPPRMVTTEVTEMEEAAEEPEAAAVVVAAAVAMTILEAMVAMRITNPRPRPKAAAAADKANGKDLREVRQTQTQLLRRWGRVKRRVIPTTSTTTISSPKSLKWV